MAPIHPDGTAGCSGCWEGKETAAARSTLALQATPLWAGLRQCLLVIIHFTQGGEETPRTGLKGPEGGSERGTLSWLDVCRRLGATTFTHGQSMARSNLFHAEWQGGGRGVQARDQQHALCVVFYNELRHRGPLPPLAALWAPALGLPAGLAGWNGGHRF